MVCHGHSATAAEGGWDPDPSLPFCDFSHQGSNLQSACVGDVDNNNNSDSHDLSLRLTAHGLQSRSPQGISAPQSAVRWRRERQAVGSGMTAYPSPPHWPTATEGGARAWRAAPGAGEEACAPSSQASNHPHPSATISGRAGRAGRLVRSRVTLAVVTKHRRDLLTP